MDQEGKIQLAVLENQFPQVICFVQNLTYYRSLGEASLPNEDQDFWEEVPEALFGLAILAWYNVFGDDKSDVYWSKLIKNMPKKVEQDFKNRVNEGIYKKCRENIKTLRDKYFAHRDRNWQKHIWNSPDFEFALKIAKVYECWLNGLLQKEISDSINSLDAIIKSAKNEVKHVLYKQKGNGTI
jgi:hypothetical protein